MLNKKTKKIVSFLASGRGSNFKAVAEKIISGHIKAKPGILICDKPDAAAFEKAARLGINAVYIDPKSFLTKADYETEMIKHFAGCNTDYIVAAGYMRILSAKIIQQYKNRIINIHPSLLPAFQGKDAQKQAIEYGVKITGCSTHFVDEGTDTGPIILQRPVHVSKNDTVHTLAEKILKEEHKLLIKSVKLLCEDKIEVRGRYVLIH